MVEFNDSAPVAQLDRASGYEPEGREFESLRAHQFKIFETKGFRSLQPEALTVFRCRVSVFCPRRVILSNWPVRADHPSPIRAMAIGLASGLKKF